MRGVIWKVRRLRGVILEGEEIKGVHSGKVRRLLFFVTMDTLGGHFG